MSRFIAVVIVATCLASAGAAQAAPAADRYGVGAAAYAPAAPSLLQKLNPLNWRVNVEMPKFGSKLAPQQQPASAMYAYPMPATAPGPGTQVAYLTWASKPAPAAQAPAPTAMTAAPQRTDNGLYGKAISQIQPVGPSQNAAASVYPAGLAGGPPSVDPRPRLAAERP